MRRLAIIGAIACLLAGAFAASAQADYFITQKRAEHFTRDYFHYKLGYHYTAAGCRPQGLSKPQPGYDYHRWVCYFLAGDSGYDPACKGYILIAGSSSSSGTYNTRVLSHTGKCYYGV